MDMNPATLTNPGLFPATPIRETPSVETERDAALMVRTAQGDRDAFADLIDLHKDALVSYLTRLSGCPQRAEDLAQEAFLRLYRSADRYREEGRLAAYLFRIATNLVRSAQRQEGRRQQILLRFLPSARGTTSRTSTSGSTERSDPALSVAMATPAPSPERSALAAEEQGQVATALAELPLSFRVPLVLYEIEGWSYEEIADLLGCRPGTLKSRLHRGRQRLKAALTPYWHRAHPSGDSAGETP